MKKLFKNKKGFTLVELMVVVAILGILVAVAIPVYNSVTVKAQINTCAANLRTIESAIMQAEINEDTVTAGPLSASGLGEYLKDMANITCPGNGAYTIVADADTGELHAKCSLATHGIDKAQ